MEFDNKQNTDVSSILYILYMCIKYYNIDNIITNNRNTSCIIIQNKFPGWEDLGNPAMLMLFAYILYSGNEIETVSTTDI